MKDKILFLDFDGVIRLANADGENPLFSKRACGLINRLCDITGAKIVVTSDLRNYAPFDTMEGLARLVPIDWNHYHNVWKTQNLRNCRNRCLEIQHWLIDNTNDETCFVCIDDTQEIYVDEETKSRCVWTNYREGFTRDKFEEALEMFK